MNVFNEYLKLVHANSDDFKSSGNRIIEIDDDRLAAMRTGDATNFDMKYELFCKWLQQNEQNHLANGPNERSEIDDRHSVVLLTEDEVSSFATNSDDDSGSDIFLDTESDFPLIVLSSDETDSLKESINYLRHGMEPTLGEFRDDTPSRLSVSDFDCSSSDVTVNSRVSNSSSQIAKRKAKHNKGRAPPIPSLMKTSSSTSCDRKNDPSNRETDI